MPSDDSANYYEVNLDWLDNCDSSNTVTISLDNCYSIDDLSIDIDAADNWTTGSDLTGNITFHSAEYTKNREMLDNIFAPKPSHMPYGTNGKTFEYINRTGVYNSHDAGLYVLERLARGTRGR